MASLGAEMVIRNSEPHFKLISKKQAVALDYIETIGAMGRSFGSLDMKSMLYATLLLGYPDEQDF